MNKPALISLTFDDGLRCQFEQAVPILDGHGLAATFFLVANTDPIHTDGHMHPDWRKSDWSEPDIRFFKDMIRRGHEIGAHSVSHRRLELDKDPKGEAEKSKRWIEERLDVEVPSYCYPFYHITTPIKSAVVHAGYKQARAGTNEFYYSQQSQIDWFAVDCRQISQHGVDYIGGQPIGRDGAEDVNGWLQPGCWHVLTYHGIGTVNDGWWSISVAEFARQMNELAGYRDSGRAEIVTFKDASDRLRTDK